jgi:imidazolonepropionase-like amidohydrolase
MPMLEIEAMLESGMTPMQIIVAATQNGAHVCNLGDEIGTLEVGKVADILVVDGAPLSDVQALARTLLVVHDGVVIQEQ